jgi:hypothetical protein
VREGRRPLPLGPLTLTTCGDFRRMPGWSPALTRGHRAGDYDSDPHAAVSTFAKSEFRFGGEADTRSLTVTTNPEHRRRRTSSEAARQQPVARSNASQTSDSLSGASVVINSPR